MGKKLAMQCDGCDLEIVYNKNEVYHASAVIENEWNGHVHLCEKCYEYNFGKLKELKVRVKRA